jgi:hemolysin III
MLSGTDVGAMDTAVPRLCLGRMQNPVRGFLHGSAAVLSLVGAAVLARTHADNPGMRIALCVFAASLVGLYTVSSLYHSFPWQEEWKDRMQRVDHSMIYLVVAGTYTPFALAVLGGWWLVAALVTTWGIAIVGVAQKIFWPQVGHWVSITMQIVQGWLALPCVGMVARTLPAAAFWLLLLGGLSYTVGAVFFVTRRPQLWPHVFSYHEVFHLCVVAGSALHYAAIVGYVASA